jgi:glycogen(starch) synthase
VKILLSSYVFSPSVGGIETVSELITPEFVRAGHEVILITATGENDHIKRPYAVERRPGWRRMLELLRWCDVYFQNNISLVYAWPLLFIRRPWVIAHHTWLAEFPKGRNWKARLKRSLLRFGTNATISKPVASDLPLPSTIVGNPYAPEIFKRRPEIPRDRELVYLGRLVSDKGIDLLIEAIAELRERGLRPHLTIIGSGQEEAALRQLTRERQLEGQIEFLGSKKPAEIARLLNAHQILVVPSRWPEPFGIVALEGIACGCVVAASEAGGLPQAIGPCGLTFTIADRDQLAETLERLLKDPQLRNKLTLQAEKHLQQFQPSVVAGKYLEVFKQSLRTHRAIPCR